MGARHRCLQLFSILSLACGALFAQAPVLFYSDVTSAPNTGGENGNGAYVTLYGNFFGASQGASAVTAGSGSMVNCKVWGAAWLWYQKDHLPARAERHQRQSRSHREWAGL